MKYYSEETVKGLLEQMDSHFVKYLENLPSIEVNEPHGRCIDADVLLQKNTLIERNVERKGVVYKQYDSVVFADEIEDVPTVLEATEGRKNEQSNR